MTPDPYPDLAVAELVEPVTGSWRDDAVAEERPELSEADSRLLDALSHPEPPVVTAVEDQPRRDRTALRSPSGSRSPLTPVFQEPVR